jgi:hypothetical protein
MAFFAPVNGDAQPVFALDTRNGPIAPSTATAASPVQPQGPKLDFYRLVAANTMASQQGVQGFVANAIRAIQQTSTVAMYQVDGTQLSVAIYPTGAYGDSAANPPTTTSTTIFLAAANSAAVLGTNQFDSCTSIGFKLAAS